MERLEEPIEKLNAGPFTTWLRGASRAARAHLEQIETAHADKNARLERVRFWADRTAVNLAIASIDATRAAAARVVEIARKLEETPTRWVIGTTRRFRTRPAEMTPSVPFDAVDEASWESFPASDPPGF